MSETMPNDALPALPTNPDPLPPPASAAAPAPAPAAAPVASAPAAPAAPVAPAAAAAPVAPAPPATMVIDVPEWLREETVPAARLPGPAAPAAPVAPVVVPPVPAAIDYRAQAAVALQALNVDLYGDGAELATPAEQAEYQARSGRLAAAVRAQAMALLADEEVAPLLKSRAAAVYEERANQVREGMELQTRALGAQESFRNNLYASLPAFAGFKGSYVEREILAPEAVAELRRHGVQDEAGLAALDKGSFEAISRNIITRIAFRFGAGAETLAEHAAWVAANPGASPPAAAAPAAGAGAAAGTAVPVGGSAGMAPPRVAVMGGFVPVGGMAPRSAALNAEAQVTAALRSYMSETEGV